MAWYSNLAWIVAQVAPTATKAATTADTIAAGDEGSGMIKLLVALAVLVGSFVGGSLLARALKVPEYSFRIGLVLFTLVASLAINYFGWPPKRGIDLSGGVVLVYEVDTSMSTNDWMQTAITRINEQLNEGGGEKLQAKPLSAEEIEIDVPDGADVAEVEKKITNLRNTADIVLHVVSRKTTDGVTKIIYRADAQAQRRVNMPDLIQAVQRRINPGGQQEIPIRQYGAEQIEIIIPNVDEREVEQIKQKISTSGLLEFRIVANETDDKELIKVALRTAGRDVYIGGRLEGRWVNAGEDVLRTLPPPEATYRPTPTGKQEVLVRIDHFNVDGRYLSSAQQDFDEKGRLAVGFSFDSVGSEKFGQLTSRNLPDEANGFERHLGIVLDNTLLSAPSIISTIRGRGIISGSFTPDYVEVLVGVLNAGRLPATLRPEPISQQRISSQLGEDTIRAGTNAMLISTLAVLVFMAVYYRFAGLVADVAVVMNIVITVALMILIKAAFTLPGLAGLVLTVGMAVDANVLIYERIREESARGASLRMAIRNGYSRAMATIIDSHVTTLLTGVVLYVIGTDQIKGFAVTLILGLLMSLFTAVYVSRIFFDVAERRRWITQLKMMQFVGETHFDFIRYCNPAIAVSAVIIGAGLVAGIMRGSELLDIDFTGGSSVQIVFEKEKAKDIAEVREAVAGLPDVAVSAVGESDLDFKIDTSEKDLRTVQGQLKEIFGDALKTYNMTVGDLTTIEAAAPAAGTTSGEATVPAAAEPATTAPADAAKGEPETKPAPPAAEPAASEPKTDAPAATPPAAEAPSAETPAATPAAEEKPADTPAPQSLSVRQLTPQGIQLASTNDGDVVLALQDPPAAEAAPAATAPAETPAPEKPAAETSAPTAPAAATPSAATDPTVSAATQAEVNSAAAAAEATLSAAEAPAGSMIGGTRVTLTFPEEIAHNPLRDLIDGEFKALKLTDATFRLTNPAYQADSEARYADWTLETSLKADQTRQLLDSVQKRLTSSPVFPSSSEIGGKVAGDTQLMAVYAMLASMVMIVLYVWIRFQSFTFGLASVLALVHDVLVAMALLALSYYLSPYLGVLLVDPFKISLAVVAALLTIVGFSINDTIVVFDRIREVRGKSPDVTADMINLSLNQTLSRTILTSGTVFITCVILYVAGGPGIHAFAFTMVVGVIAGTYSSVYIAAPVILWMLPTAAKPTGKPGTPNTPATAGRK